MKNFLKKTMPYLAIALVFSLLGAGAVMTVGNVNGTLAQAEAVPLATKLEGVATSPFTEPVKAVKDSVVGVSTFGYIDQSYTSSQDPFGFGFSFGFGGRFYGSPAPKQTQPQEDVELGSGSGVVISDQGHILTNYHVISSDKNYLVINQVKVSVGDQWYDAQVIDYDQEKDIAIIQAKGLKLNPVSLGDSDTLQVGEWAIAIGNPLSEEFVGTTTVGVVSGLNRSVTSKISDEYGRVYEATNPKMIQVDAAINSGNSGGGLFNVLGELVGIPTLKYSSRIYSDQASIDNIGMCIPINDAKPMIEDVLSGKVTAPEDKSSQESPANQPVSSDVKPRLGIGIGNAQTNFPLFQDGTLPIGIVISNVEENSPAEKAGLLKNDIIVEANGTRTSTTTDLKAIIDPLQEGDTVTLKVFRLPYDLDNYNPEDEIPEGNYADIPVVLEIIDVAVQ